MDSIKIEVKTNYGDKFVKELSNPKCEELADAIVEAAQQLGFPLQCIQSALESKIQSS